MPAAVMVDRPAWCSYSRCYSESFHRTDPQAFIFQRTHRIKTFKQRCGPVVSIELNLPVLLDEEQTKEKQQPAGAETQRC